MRVFNALSNSTAPRKCQLALFATLVLSLSAIFQLTHSQDRKCRVRISLVDAKTNNPIPGVIRSSLVDNPQAIPIAGLLPRGQGIGLVELRQQRKVEKSSIHEWYVLGNSREILLPRKMVRLVAFSGLETESKSLSLDLTDRNETSITIPLRPFSNLAQKSWFGGNTHLHLFGLSREQSDAYLGQVPMADRLDILFLSHVKRPSEDSDYISNSYPVGDLRDLQESRVLVSNGEEHRNNFQSFGEGYGHVILLNIRSLIEPVSIGPGITGQGSDGIPLQVGIDEAHRQGGVAIWCHNNSGTEAVPSAVSGKLDALNIFDGVSLERYEDSFYHYLNAGLRVPFSTGTDWFIYDLSRVYTQVRGRLEIKSWLDALAAGRSFITNGPVFDFNVDGKGIGDSVNVSSGQEVTISGEVRGRLDFGRLELVHNGRVIDHITSRARDVHFFASLRRSVKIEVPSWLALRVSSQTKSEYGQPLFGHTSPIYVTVSGKSIRIQQEVDYLIERMLAAQRIVSTRAVFGTPEERARILAIYRRSIDKLRQESH